MDNLRPLIEIIKIVRNKITDNTDIVWTKYNNTVELQMHIDKNLNLLENGDKQALEEFKHLFMPTSTFQEISISNGWGEEYLELAERFDEAYEKIKNGA